MTNFGEGDAICLLSTCLIIPFSGVLITGQTIDATFRYYIWCLSHYFCYSIIFVPGSEVIVPRAQLSCRYPASGGWINVTGKLSDNNVDTCNTFVEYNDLFTYLWFYAGETIGPLHVHVIGSCSCWPETTLQVMQFTPAGHIEYCSPQEEVIKHEASSKACLYYCQCRNCRGYVLIQLPMKGNTLMTEVCEILLK